MLLLVATNEVFGLTSTHGFGSKASLRRRTFRERRVVPRRKVRFSESFSRGSYLARIEPLMSGKVDNQVMVRRSFQIRLEASPLLGGPSWLPLHVKVILQPEKPVVLNSKNKEIQPEETDYFEGYRRHCYIWDFIPVNATELSTLWQLVTLQAVQGKIRFSEKIPADSSPEKLQDSSFVVYRQSLPLERLKDGDFESIEQSLLKRAHEYCGSYREDALHLVYNNCWAFALGLCWQLKRDVSLSAEQRVEA